MPSRSLLLVALLILGVTVPFLLSDSSPSAAPTDHAAAGKAETRVTALWQRIVGGIGQSTSASADPSLEEAAALLAENQQLLTGQPVNSQQLGGTAGRVAGRRLAF